MTLKRLRDPNQLAKSIVDIYLRRDRDPDAGQGPAARVEYSASLEAEISRLPRAAGIKPQRVDTPEISLKMRVPSRIVRSSPTPQREVA
jgi:hypothetical protein